MTVPNRANLPPGSRVPLYFYDVTKDGWYSPGQGTVADDGSKIVPDPGAGITRLGCLADPGTADGKVVCVEDCGTGAGGDGGPHLRPRYLPEARLLAHEPLPL